MEEPDSCFICLGCDEEQESPLEVVCQCPNRPVHRKCLARWQLQCAGRKEENTCRFCDTHLPDWRNSLTPPAVKPEAPVMAIKFEGKVYKLRVHPGPEGLMKFKDQVRELLGVDITMDFDVSFECQVPSTGEHLMLHGLQSYGAATHCAAITAGERSRTKPTRQHVAEATPKTEEENRASALAAHEARALHRITAATAAGQMGSPSAGRRVSTRPVPEPPAPSPIPTNPLHLSQPHPPTLAEQHPQARRQLMPRLPLLSHEMTTEVGELSGHSNVRQHRTAPSSHTQDVSPLRPESASHLQLPLLHNEREGLSNTAQPHHCASTPTSLSPLDSPNMMGCRHSTASSSSGAQEDKAPRLPVLSLARAAFKNTFKKGVAALAALGR